MKNILEVVYRLRNDSMVLYLKDADNFVLKRSQESVLSDNDKDFLRSNKPEIIEFLKFNNLFSESIAKTTNYYKIPLKYYDHKLSEFQKGVYLQTKIDQLANTYTVPVVVQLNSVIHDLLYRAIFEVVTKESILRMTVTDGLTYKFLSPDDINISAITILETNISTYINQQANKVFNLDGEQLISPEIVNISGGDDVLLGLTHSHIISDAYSCELMVENILSTYEKLRSNVYNLHAIRDLDKQLNYFDFNLYQQYQLQTSKYREAISLLAHKLEGSIPLNLKKSLSKLDNSGTSFTFLLANPVVQKLDDISNNYQVTIYAVLVTCLSYVLGVYNNQQESFPIGLTVSNRPYDFNNTIGPFINTLPLISDIYNASSILAAILQINREIIYLNEHHLINLSDLATGHSGLSARISELMQVMFTMHNFSNNLSTFKTCYTYINIPEVTEKFGISITAKTMPENIIFNVSYAKNLYAKEYIEHIFTSYQNLLNKLTVEVIESKFSSELLLSQTEYTQITKTWNETKQPYPDDKTISQLFEDQASKTPDNIALIYENIRLSYKELNERANQLANYLKQQFNIVPDDLITLCLDRNEHMLIAVLGILKSGAAYVPLDPEIPSDRMLYVLEDTKAKTFLVNSLVHLALIEMANLNTRLKFYLAKSIVIDSSEFATLLDRQETHNLATATTSRNLAYVIYTSGTTGMPKGVMLEHAGVVNRIIWMNTSYQLTSQDRILQKTPYVFDVSVWELFWANWYGATIVFARVDGHKDNQYLINLIHQAQITVTHFVPSMFSTFLAHLGLDNEDLAKVKSLRYIFCSGEALSINTVLKCHELMPQVELHNLYGPTEASIDVLYYACNARDISKVCIGKPIFNTQAYILNDHGHVVPCGSIGELYIGGIGLARGYLNQSDLTAQKFISNPFQSEYDKLHGLNSRLYKTGDLASYLPSGDIEYIGRNDFQVKIRGYRIELAEIEAVLSNFSGIKQNIVLAREHKNTDGVLSDHKYLVGYYTSELKFDEAEILKYIASKVPDYMVPNFMIHLDVMPVTINGKLDRKLLPEPNFTNKVKYICPRDDLERKLCTIYAKILGLDVDKLSITDDFFSLGGDSIISLQLVSQLRQELDMIISVKDIFTYTTIERLYDNVVAKQDRFMNHHILTERGLLVGTMDKLPIQQWFFNAVSSGRFKQINYWNQAFLIRIPTQLNLSILKASIVKLIEYHDAFRIRYTKKVQSTASENKPMEYSQYYRELPHEISDHSDLEKLNIWELDLTTIPNDLGAEVLNDKLYDILSNWQRGFDLEYGPLHCIAYIHGYADGSSRVFFSLHHLIVDGVSWRILAQDLQVIYDQLALAYNNGEFLLTMSKSSEDLLGFKGTSYRQWINIVNNYAKNHNEERGYWRKIINAASQQRTLFEPFIETETTSNIVRSELSKDMTVRLLTNSGVDNLQINDILLTALALTLSKFTACDEHYITLEGHGREEIVDFVDISRTIGWFTTMYPVRLKTSLENIAENLSNTQQSLRSIPHNGIGYGALFGYDVEELPAISFNYFGQLDNLLIDNSINTTGSWLITDESTGNVMSLDNIDANILNINAYVSSGILHFSFLGKISLLNLELLANLFKENLQLIALYLSNESSLNLDKIDISGFETYIEFKCASSTDYVFLLPPGHGGAESYLRNIVPKLQNINVIVFNNYLHYLDKMGCRDISLESVAEFYTAEIKKIQPIGPYRLSGWSFGGVLSFEISRQLLLTGDTVSHLMLLDTYFALKKYSDTVKVNTGKVEPIIYNYLASIKEKIDVLPTLIKCTKYIEDVADEYYELYKYYTATQFNNLDDLVDARNITVIFSSTHHLTCLDDAETLDKIAFNLTT